jgi:CTP synthase
MEILEIEDHPYFIGTQFHPEFKSRPTRPSPPFLGLLDAALERRSQRLGETKESKNVSRES